MLRLILVAAPRDQLVLTGGAVRATVPLGDVDWSREVAVIVDLGEQRTGGYSLTVTGATVVPPDRIDLQVQVNRPRPGAMVPQVFTHPYAVVRVPSAGLQKGAVTLIARDARGTEIARQVAQL